MSLLGLFLMGTAAYLLLMLILSMTFLGGLYLALRPGARGELNAGRRAFLGGRKEGGHALFFGLQLVIQIFGSDELRARLSRLVEAEDATDTAEEKRRFFKSVA